MRFGFRRLGQTDADAIKKACDDLPDRSQATGAQQLIAVAHRIIHHGGIIPIFAAMRHTMPQLIVFGLALYAAYWMFEKLKPVVEAAIRYLPIIKNITFKATLVFFGLCALLMLVSLIRTIGRLVRATLNGPQKQTQEATRTQRNAPNANSFINNTTDSGRNNCDAEDRDEIENLHFITPKRRLLIDFIDLEGKRSRRVIKLLGFDTEDDEPGSGIFYVRAWCEMRRAYRTFSFSGIQSAADPETGELVDDLHDFLWSIGRRNN